MADGRRQAAELTSWWMKVSAILTMRLSGKQRFVVVIVAVACTAATAAIGASGAFGVIGAADASGTAAALSLELFADS